MTLVLSIEKFSLNDGLGIRTTIFLKGCPLKCPWCHNPESQSPHKQLSYNKDVCIGCKKCVLVCTEGVHNFTKDNHEVEYDKCIGCGKCVNACLNNALRIYGESIKIEEIIFEVMKDKKYYDASNGGVTISGGEPMMHNYFLLNLLCELKKNQLHICIETSGAGSEEFFIKTSKLTDLYLIDIKVEFEKYKEIIGIDFSTIKRNLTILEKLGSKVILRLPLIEGINDSELHFDQVIELAKSPNIIGVEILPYHSIGRGKAIQIGAEYCVDAKPPPNDVVNMWIDKLSITHKLMNLKSEG